MMLARERGQASNPGLPGDPTNSGHGHTETLTELLWVQHRAFRAESEEQFIILASPGQHLQPIESQLATCPLKATRCWQSIRVDLSPQRRSVEELAQVARQSIG